MVRTEVTPIEGQPDYFQMKINDIPIGVFERSQLREIIEKIDNAI